MVQKRLIFNDLNNQSIVNLNIGHLRISIGWLGDEEARDERFELSDEVNQVRSSLSSAPRALLQIQLS